MGADLHWWRRDANQDAMELQRLAHEGAVDADGHVLEPPDLWDRYLEARWRDRPMGIRRDAEGQEYLEIDGRPSKMVRRYLPDGTLDRFVSLPVSNPTNATFGGRDLDALFVTTTQLALGPKNTANGGVYVVKTGFFGLPEPMVSD